MTKYFVASDIHSFYDEWMTALNEAGFDIDNKDHHIIVCGDLLDRGEKPIECLKFVNKLYDESRAILIKGNHEDLLEELLLKRYPESHDVHNGTWDTIELLAGMSAGDCCSPDKVKKVIEKAKKNKELKKYLSHVIDYVELGDNIFVHGWIPLDYNGHDIFWNKLDLSYNPNWREETDWSDARWYNGMHQWKQGNGEPEKTIWCGHYHASFGNSRYHNDGKEFLNRFETMSIDPETGKLEPHENHHTFKDDGIVALDACTIHSRFVNVEVLEI